MKYKEEIIKLVNDEIYRLNNAITSQTKSLEECRLKDVDSSRFSYFKKLMLRTTIKIQKLNRILEYIKNC